MAHKICQWKHQEDSMCPICGKEESVDHIFQCKHKLASEYWEEGISKLEIFLKKKVHSTNDHITRDEGVTGVDARG